MLEVKRIPYYGVLALLIYMPFHIFLAQSVSLATGGLDIWKIGKDIVLFGLTLFTICLVWKQRAETKDFNWLVGFGAAYFILHILLWGLNSDIYSKSAILGTIYNTRLPAFLILGYGASLLNPGKFVFSSIFKVILGVSSVVAALGALQYFLPKDLLSHLGYSLERGTRPAFFIDDNPAFPRIMSTLREPNALGAYLVLPLSALTWLIISKLKVNRRTMLLAGLWLLHASALFLTFSRSAWLGAFLALSLVLWWKYKSQIANELHRYGTVVVVCVMAVFAVAFFVRDTNFFQHYVIHGNPEEQVVDLDSNDYHTLLLRQGLEGIVDRPLGHGPGTAGIVSIQNPAGGQLTENYYIQIGFEVGILGLVLFVWLNIWVYLKLRNRNDSLAIILCASFWGYVVINMLLHSWSNEAVAAQWWLLAGVAVATTYKKSAPEKANL